MMTEKRRNWYGWYVVFISALIGVSMTTSFPQFTMVVGEYAEKLHITQEFLLFTDTVRSISIMGAMLVSGPIYRRLGLKKTFVCAITAMVVPQILMPHVTSALIVLALKIIQGFCSVIFPVFLITIMDWMDKSNVGTATAVFNGIFYGGAGIGATVAGFSITAFGWKGSFYVVALMALIPSILWLFTVKEKEGLQPGHSAEEGESANPGHFVEEGESANKEYNRSVNGKGDDSHREKTFQTVVGSLQSWILVICLISTVWMTQVLSVDLPLYGNFLRYDAAAVGLVMSSLSFGIFLACVVSGKISDYFAGKSKNPATARLIVFAFGPLFTILAILLMFIIDGNRFPVFYAAVLFLSFAGAWGFGSFYCILPELMEKRKVEYATGFIGGIADIGMPVGPLIFGVAFGVKGLWTAAWVSCIIICLISVFGSAVLVRSNRRGKRVAIKKTSNSK